MMIDRHIETISKIIYHNSDWLRKAYVFLDINNIALWLWKFGSKKEWNLLDVNFAIPPWPFMWCEYSCNNLFKNTSKIENIGIMTCVDEIKDEKYYKIDCIVFIETKINNIIDIIGYLQYDIDNNGNIIKGSMAAKINDKYAEINKIKDLFKEFVMPYFFSLIFMNCKNVEVIKKEISLKLQKSRIKRGKTPFIKFNTIIIDPMRKIIEKETPVGRKELNRALHICRGHFATYLPDAPLFGRVTGTFWRPMHSRGNLMEGIVIKNYEIKSPPPKEV